MTEDGCGSCADSGVETRERSNFAELLRPCPDWTGFLLGERRLGEEGEEGDLDSVATTTGDDDGRGTNECGTRDGFGIKGTLGGGGRPELIGDGTWRGGVKESKSVPEVCATATIPAITPTPPLFFGAVGETKIDSDSEDCEC